MLGRLAPAARVRARLVCSKWRGATDDQASWSCADVQRMGRAGKRGILAAAAGNLTALQWVLSTLPLRAAAVRSWGAFETACAHGRLPAARWLAGALEIQPHHIRAWGALAKARAGGHHELALWIEEVYGGGTARP